jgi:WD40 repeat protein
MKHRSRFLLYPGSDLLPIHTIKSIETNDDSLLLVGAGNTFFLIQEGIKPKSLQQFPMQPDEGSWVTSGSMSDSRRFLAVGTNQGFVLVLDRKKDRKLTFRAGTSKIKNLEFAENGNILIVADEIGVLRHFFIKGVSGDRGESLKSFSTVDDGRQHLQPPMLGWRRGLL